MIHKYIPQIIEDNYATMLVQLMRCTTCGEIMASCNPGNAFPSWRLISYHAQVKNAGWKLESKHFPGVACEECANGGLITFLCCMCNTLKTTDKIKDEYGDPPEYLCTDCFSKVTAKAWSEKVDYLHQKHRYDFD